MLSLILSVLVGGGIGSMMGYFGQCSSGTCPLTSTWWRGALYGAGMGLLVGLSSFHAASAPSSHSTPSAKPISAEESDTVRH